MKIGELADITDLAPSRIRFYERIGLLKTVSRKANGYRTYPPEAVTVLKLITTAQQAGFSLDELRTLLPADLGAWDHGSLLDALQQKIRDIEEIQARLTQSKAQLQAVLAELKSKPEDMDCASNAKRVLSQFGLGTPTAGKSS
ncbi:MerR family transcriptional regulator [Alloalcanivorax xenomutans]|jgi:DNA-binding transcriptional MerR regulator|uniref:MerR family transcriptional regulator n=1 Tax=Alloalcanivorax xenomutans TaxID=1094342 RepID=UPI0006D5CA95|nr:MerR family transcriptional regulator [Alloalcanivorax xenomutans]ARB45875.1 MerR family transcriptional regulator [Alloalcanivorax xenomutans]PHS60871.1 MAG: MerR family transcriptional regulator [Alcanivorax sp.]CUR47255.1 Mercuric resistance operon regulatory protein [Alloalcanivorax xenomutans]